jgi:hypothetical protein
MRSILLIACPLFLAFKLPACREKPHPIAKPHGLALTTLPTAVNAPVFAPADGHYAELLLRDGQWQGYVDGKAMGTLKDLDQISEFIRSFIDRENVEGRKTIPLISADGRTPFSQIQIATRGLATGGTDQIYFLVQSLSGSHKPLTNHAVVLEFICLHCRLMGYDPNPDLMVIVLMENGSIQRDNGDSLSELDDSNADSKLPGLDTALRQYAASIQGGNFPPLVRVRVDNKISYQRFIDVLCRLQNHGMIPEWFDADEELE